ncbi:unnamed protein product [Hymenolepis diminuta]|uniref:Uncharacterized protein n=1 Tax=Hymenolepis diminuta TaxID=6216 RepID=A0A564YFF6_HYMDI|nr:unnamed protein product [Hymenolepis diminuta]
MKKDAILQQALKNLIRQDPVLCPQTKTPWTRLPADFAGPFRPPLWRPLFLVSYRHGDKCSLLTGPPSLSSMYLFGNHVLPRWECMQNCM